MSLDEKEDKLIHLGNINEVVRSQIRSLQKEKTRLFNRIKECDTEISFLNAKQTIIKSDMCITKHGDHKWYEVDEGEEDSWDRGPRCEYCDESLHRLNRAKNKMLKPDVLGSVNRK